MKKSFRAIFTALFLTAPLFGAEILEKDDTIVLSGKNYELRLNRGSGAVRSIRADGQTLTLSSRKNGLWSAKFIDGTVQSAQTVTAITRPDSSRIVLHYDTASLSVAVTLTPKDEYVDFQAELTPRSGDVLEFAVPGRLNFSPDAVGGVACHVQIPTNIGTRFNANFFRPSRNSLWKIDRTIGDAAVRSLFGSPFLNLGDHTRDIPLTVTEEASAWLLPKDIEKLHQIRLTPSRPFSDGQAEIAFLKYKDKVVMGGTQFGGEGLFFRTGTFRPSNDSFRKIMEIIISVIQKRQEKHPGSPRSRIAFICLPYGAGAPKPEVRDWLTAFRNASIEPQMIRTPEELEAAMVSPETAAIINPGNEFCIPLPGKNLVAMMKDLKQYVKDGGYWFETCGYSFYHQLGPQNYMTTGRSGVPGALADFFHFNLNGRNAALYAVQPVTWEPFEGERNRDAIFVPSLYELGGCGEGGFLDRSFLIYAYKGRSFRTPVTRLRFGENALDSLKSFARDNRIMKTLEEKASAGLRDAVRQAVLFHPQDRKSSERAIRQVLPYLPEHTIVHVSQYLKGGFDKQYPDHLPPAKWWGTMDGFRSLVREIKARNLLFMPYTNNTWWCDNPRGPTFLKAGEAALQKDLNGKNMKEAYAANGGWGICMWHPAVRKANDTLTRQFTEELPSDILFQDQCGLRKSYSSAQRKVVGYDRNPASPAPHAATEGFLSQVRTDARRAPLATEECWWGIIDQELMICGFSGAVCQFMAWQGSIWNKWPSETWNFFPMIQGLAHDKSFLGHHDLAGDVNTSARAAWTLALGYNMVSRADPLDPAQREWLRWIDRLQKSVCARYAGKGISSFQHEWGDSMEPGIIRAVYGKIAVTANLRSKPLAEGRLTIAPDGFSAQGDGVLAGVISGSGSVQGTGTFVLDGSTAFLYAAPGSTVIFPLPSAPCALNHQKRALAFEYRDGTVICTLPAEDGSYKRLWRIEIER